MKTVLIIGAAGGVGLEVARALAARDYNVVGTVLNAAEETLLREHVPAVSQVFHIDLGNAEATRDKLTAAAASLPVLDSVAVCAAISPTGPVELCPLDLMRKTLEINTVSQVAAFQALAPKLRESKGRLLYITSMSGKIGLPFIGVYTASKFALEGIADTMRQEAASFGVAIILVEPGGIRTPLVRKQLDDVERDIATLAPEIDQRYGHLYRGFRAAATKSYNEAGGGAGSTADQVAAVVVEALEAEKPLARYIAGEDGKQLLAARHAMSDADFDAMLGQFFAG